MWYQSILRAIGLEILRKIGDKFIKWFDRKVLKNKKGEEDNGSREQVDENRNASDGETRSESEATDKD